MSVRCPEGHLTESLDYCDVCGTPVGAPAATPADVLRLRSDDAGAQAPEPEVGTGPEPQTCPHCGALNVADALFCEACGYDFTTGTPPMGSAPLREDEDDDEEYAVAPLPADDAADQGPGGEEPVEEEAPAEEEGAAEEEQESLVEEPESVVEEPEPADDEPEPVEDGPQPADDGPEPVEDAPQPEPESRPEAEPDPRPQPEPEREAPQTPEAPEVPAQEAGRTPQRRARHTPPSRALAEAWVVELWIDPDWYAVQQTEENIPSPGVPDIVLLTRSTALIGRPSGSLGARPEVDAGADSAVSRRHAQLTSDGRRWWIEDLGSSNGTYIGTVGEPLPSAPVTPGVRVEIDRDDRIYVGAWTRLVVRQATASEQAGQG